MDLPALIILSVIMLVRKPTAFHLHVRALIILSVIMLKGEVRLYHCKDPPFESSPMIWNMRYSGDHHPYSLASSRSSRYDRLSNPSSTPSFL